jgi:glycosyltransferase involved in cell wall biosynthesis
MENLEIPFSVIMPFYHGDNPNYFDEALNSLFQQSLRANEVVLIQDGEVSEQHLDVIQRWKQKMPEIDHLILEKNQGLSSALNAGIEAAQHEWLARMDADDICATNRFENQIEFLKSNSDVSVLGSWITEFTESIEQPTGIRTLPETSKEIAQSAKWRCPFNHMTVFFKKSDLLQLGLYRQNTENTAGFGEDYELWARYLVNGYKTHNLQESLVFARTDNDFFENRRRGKKYFQNEVHLLKELKTIGLINSFQYFVHYVVKYMVRMAPPGLVKLVYSVLRKKTA